MTKITITSTKQLQDLIIEMIEIDNAITIRYEDSFLHEQDKILLTDLKNKLINIMVTINSIIKKC